MTAFTLVIQLTLMNLSILVTINGHLIYAIAIAIISVNTPMILSKYLVKPNGSIINSAGNTARNLRALTPRLRRRRFKKHWHRYWKCNIYYLINKNECRT